MPLPWKKSKSGRISRFVSDLQQSPKHGGSLVVQTGFPTSLIDLFVKNRDRLKIPSSKRCNKAQTQTAPPPLLPLQRSRSLPQKLDPAASVTEDPSLSKIEESFCSGLTAAIQHDGDEDGVNRGGGGCVLMVVVVKVFVVAVLAFSTKKLAVGVTLSAFALLFIELVVARVFTHLNHSPDTQFRLDSLMGKLIGKRRQEKLEESSSRHKLRNKVSSEIIEEWGEEIRVPQAEQKSNWEDLSSKLDKAKPNAEKKKVQTIRDVVFKNEKSKTSKLKSKIVKKIVPNKLRSYKKKKKLKFKEEEFEEEEEEESVKEVSSLFSEERIESEISERDYIGSNPPLLDSCGETEEEVGSKGDLMKPMVLSVIVLAGLLGGKVVAIGLTFYWCLNLRVFCCKSQTSL